MRYRLYRIVVAFLPRDFRAQFSAEMLDTARLLDLSTPLRWRQVPGVVIDALAMVIAIRREIRLETRSIATMPRRTTMDSLWQDFRFALRGLRRDISFTTFVVATLTLGIGANAAMFGIVDRLLLTGPPHIKDEGRVVRFYMTYQPEGMRRFTSSTFGYVSYALAVAQSQSFDRIANYSVNDVVIGEGANAELRRGGYASASLFPLLGVRAAVGRFFDESENSITAASRVAVLSFGAWQRWFGGRGDVIGQAIVVGGQTFAIVGVAPRGFTGPQFGPVDLWMPMNLRGPRVLANGSWQTSWNAQWLQVIGRLKPHVGVSQAGLELTSIHQRGYTGNESYVAKGDMTVAALSANSAGVESPEITVVRWLAGVSLIVLVIACANVANLLLARGMKRAREVAVRAALGAGRSQLIRLLLVESLLLSLGGALGGIAIAYGLGNLARHAIFSWVDWTTPPVDGRVLVVSLSLALVTGLAIGLFPAWRATRADVADALKRGVREGRGQRSRARNVLTIVQAALSVLLLVGAGLFVRSLWNVRTLPLGFDPDRVVVIESRRPPVPRVQQPTEREDWLQRIQFVTDAFAALRRIGGIEHVAAAVGTPFGNRFTEQLRVPGLSSVPKLTTGGPSLSAVTADYFGTVGTRILRGRSFTENDRPDGEAVAIVSDMMAKTVWPDRDPIGQCVIVGLAPAAPCARIVGIAEDTHRSALREPAVMHLYIPYGQEVGFGGTVLLARSTSADPMSLAASIRSAMLQVDATIRYVNIATIQKSIDPEIKPWRIGAVVFTLSGVLALIVAAIGIYSVMSYLVVDRTHEIGVRLALGARRSDVAQLILRGNVGMAAIGIVAGLIAAAAAGSLVEPLLFNVAARDPWVYGTVAIVLLTIALAAALLPIARANRISPLEALRTD